MDAKELIAKVSTIIRHGATPQDVEPIRYDELLAKAKAETISERELQDTLKALEATKMVKCLGRDKDLYKLEEKSA